MKGDGSPKANEINDFQTKLLPSCVYERESGKTVFFLYGIAEGLIAGDKSEAGLLLYRPRHRKYRPADP